MTPNYYFASTAAGVKQMQANEEDGIINGANDIFSKSAGEFNPLFANFTQQSNININTGADLSNAPMAFNDKWDFSLKSGSPALAGGKTDFTRLFGANAIAFDGLNKIDAEGVKTSYTSPAPAQHFGAFGAN